LARSAPRRSDSRIGDGGSRHPPREPPDHPFLIARVDDWWGGRAVAGMLPHLFFDHFRPTSFVAEQAGAVVGFLIGFVSQTAPANAYVHFVGVDPTIRGAGIGRTPHERFATTVRALGCREINLVTSPKNTASIAFHRRLGFDILPGDAATADGVAYTRDYDGPGEDRVRFRLWLDAQSGG